MAYEHVLDQCTPDCDRDYCPICMGGLARCTVCKGAEGSLPKHCPGHEMTEFQEAAVYAGDLDFFNGQWVDKRPPEVLCNRCGFPTLETTNGLCPECRKELTGEDPIEF